jgi:opacity protein-like surface antigen
MDRSRRHVPGRRRPNRVIHRSALAALAALALVTAPAAGQSIDSPYDFVDPSQSIWAFGSAVLPDRGTIDIGPGSGYGAGLGYSIRISGPFNFDARVAYVPTTRRVFQAVPADSAAIVEDPRVGLEEIGEADLALLLIDGSLRFDLTGPRTWYRLQPYALIGVGGVLRVSSDNAAEEGLPAEPDYRVRFKNGVTGHIGGGVEWYVTDRITVRADARDLLWKIHVPDGFLEDRVIDDEQWVQTAHLSLGLAVRF